MDITLNHTIVPCKNNVLSAEFYQKIFGFQFIKEWGAFAVVKVNNTLTFDFMNYKEFIPLHYAFKVSEDQFDEILARIQQENLNYGSSPFSQSDGKINHNDGGRGVYFKDINGHVLEIITKDYVLD